MDITYSRIQHEMQIFFPTRFVVMRILIASSSWMLNLEIVFDDFCLQEKKGYKLKEV